MCWIDKTTRIRAIPIMATTPPMSYSSVRYVCPRAQAISSTPTAVTSLRSRCARPHSTACSTARQTLSHDVRKIVPTSLETLKTLNPPPLNTTGPKVPLEIRYKSQNPNDGEIEIVPLAPSR